MSSETEQVNHPSHYNCVDYKGNQHECMDIIQALELDFFVGNALKYLWRAGKKDPAKVKEDLKKAIFYLKQELSILETY